MYVGILLTVPLISWLVTGWVHLYRLERASWWPGRPPLPIRPDFWEYAYVGGGALAWLQMAHYPHAGWSFWCLYLVGCCAALVDWRYRVLPFRISFLLGIGGIVAAWWHYVWLTHVITVIMIGSMMGILYFLSADKMGLGDVLLAMGLATWLEPLNGAWMLVLAATLGLSYALFGHLCKSLKRSEPIPFGPFLVLATWVMRCAQEGGRL